MVHFPNDDSHRPRPGPDQTVVQRYRGNIFFKGKLVFAICLQTVDYGQFLTACQKLLMIQFGIRQKISLWRLDTISDWKITTFSNSISACSDKATTLCKISSDVELRNAFGRGCSKTLVQNFVVKCEVGTDQLLSQKRVCRQDGSKKKIGCRQGKKVDRGNTTRAFCLLEVEARRSVNLQSQLRLLNRAFKQITTPISKKTTATNSVLYERRRRKFVAMLVTMRKRPERASAWLSKMRHQHAGNARMLPILSLLNIFVNNLLGNTSSAK